MEEKNEILEILCAEVRKKIIDEGITRIKYCLNQLSEDETWHKPNQNSNSVGNLVLHLCGNVRQWLVSTLGNRADNRERDNEFQPSSRVSKKELVRDLDLLSNEILQTLSKITAEDLIITFGVQGYQEKGTSILVHVIEHFSYHTGQITYFTKYIKDIDTGYYHDVDLNQKG